MARVSHRVVLHIANFSTSLKFMQSTSNHFQFHGKGAEFFKIWVVNVLLTIVTLSLYRPWARVRTKRYLYQNTEINGQRFDFHANPKSMLVGHVLVMVALAVFAVCSLFAAPIAALLTVVFWFAFPALLVRSVRFNLSNTSIGNVRMGFSGSVGDYYIVLFKFLGMLILCGVLAGLLGGLTGLVFADAPTLKMLITGLSLVVLEAGAIVYLIWKQALFFGNNAQFGDMQFQSELRYSILLRKAAVWVAVCIGGTAALVAAAIVAMISGGGLPNLATVAGRIVSAGPELLLVILPPLAFWAYKAFVQASAHNLYWNHVNLNHRHPFKSALPLGSFIGLSLINGVLTLCTFGLYYPVAKVKIISAKLESLSLGDCDQLVAESKPVEPSKGMVADSIFDSLNIDLAL